MAEKTQEAGSKPVVRYVIFEAGSLWAAVPEFGIEGWMWCVGGPYDPREKVIENLQDKIRAHCENLMRPTGARLGTAQQRDLARQIVEQESFLLFEDSSIPTI